MSVSQPGAAPNEIETQITQRVESAVRGVTGVEEINSSVREGNSFTFVQFQIGTSTDRAVNDVRNAIAQIRGNLPEGILEPQIGAITLDAVKEALFDDFAAPWSERFFKYCSTSGPYSCGYFSP